MEHKLTQTQIQAQIIRRFILDSQQIHGEDTYNYDAIDSIITDVKIKIYCNICEEHFEITSSHHLNGHGCIICENEILECEFI